MPIWSKSLIYFIYKHKKEGVVKEHLIMKHWFIRMSKLDTFDHLDFICKIFIRKKWGPIIRLVKFLKHALSEIWETSSIGEQRDAFPCECHYMCRYIWIQGDNLTITLHDSRWILHLNVQNLHVTIKDGSKTTHHLFSQFYGYPYQMLTWTNKSMPRGNMLVDINDVYDEMATSNCRNHIL